MNEIDWVLRVSWFLLGASAGVVVTGLMLWHRYSVSARVWRKKAEATDKAFDEIMKEYYQLKAGNQ